VILIEENHGFSDIIGSPAAPHLNLAAQRGALFTNSFAVTHPSEPNYFALFSGSTQGVTDDGVYNFYGRPNLAQSLLNAGLTFGSYSQGLPSVGWTGATSGAYARKHNPTVSFRDLPASLNMPFTAFPSDYSQLPTVSLVIPDQNNDMHDGTIQQADAWATANLQHYAQWAVTHNSLLVVTWDEDDYSGSNQIATIFFGPMVQPGSYSEAIDHYSVLRTIEDMYHLPYIGQDATASAITDAWVAAAGLADPGAGGALAAVRSNPNGSPLSFATAGLPGIGSPTVATLTLPVTGDSVSSVTSSVGVPGSPNNSLTPDSGGQDDPALLDQLAISLAVL
jgi:acid phosphatase